MPAYANYRCDDWTAPARHSAAIARLTRVPEPRRPAQAFVPPKLRHQYGRRWTALVRNEQPDQDVVGIR